MENSKHPFPWLSLAVGVLAVAMTLHFVSQGLWLGVIPNGLVALILLGHVAYRFAGMARRASLPPQS